jgi:hypothetical protein
MWRFILLFITFPTFGQVNICEDKQSSHPIDIKLIELKDSLEKVGIDTFILYRHWSFTNGYNGYGKLIWADKGRYFQSKFALENSKIKQIQDEQPVSDALFRFFIDNQIEQIKTNPTKQDINVSHDAQHLVQVSFKNSSSCYLILGALIISNLDNLRVKFVKLLTDEKVTFFYIDGERVRSEPIIKPKKKNWFCPFKSK